MPARTLVQKSPILKNSANPVFWSQSRIDRRDREKRNKHRGYIIWLTGLSGSGKSTVARELEHRLFGRGYQIYVLDGDNIRHGLSSDLGFSRADRQENIRRVGEVARLFAETGFITVSAFISPYENDRGQVREAVPAGEFIEVFLQCSLEKCEQRDTKGLYRKARAGVIKEFTGISDPFEAPASPELVIDTENLTPEQSVQAIIDYLREGDYL